MLSVFAFGDCRRTVESIIDWPEELSDMMRYCDSSMDSTMVPWLLWAGASSVSADGAKADWKDSGRECWLNNHGFNHSRDFGFNERFH